MVNYNTCFSYIVDELQKKKCEEKIIRAKLLPQQKKSPADKWAQKKIFVHPKSKPLNKALLSVF